MIELAHMGCFADQKVYAVLRCVMQSYRCGILLCTGDAPSNQVLRHHRMLLSCYQSHPLSGFQQSMPSNKLVMVNLSF